MAAAIVFGPPPGELTLVEAELMALCRCRALCSLDAPPPLASALPARPPPPLHPRDVAFREGFLTQKGMRGDAARWREESISHHLLRLALCGTRSRRRWLARSELKLFHRRWDADAKVKRRARGSIGAWNGRIVDAFVAAFDLPLWRAAAQQRGGPPMYRVPWELASRLVAQRRVVVRDGVAFVARGEMREVIAARLETELYDSLDAAYASRALLPVRLRPILAKTAALADKAIARWAMATGGDESDNRGGGAFAARRLPMSAATLGQHAVTSFPACMRVMVHSLTQPPTYHLKHEGRIELVTFFRSVGLPLDDAVAVMRSNFLTKISAAQWEKKKYAYSIRHIYGYEGRRKVRVCVCVWKMTCAPPRPSDPTNSHAPAHTRISPPAVHLPSWITTGAGAGSLRRAPEESAGELRASPRLPLCTLRAQRAAHDAGDGAWSGRRHDARNYC